MNRIKIQLHKFFVKVNLILEEYTDIDQNHLGYVDTLKGIGIILVVVGHVYKGLISDVIFIFHMPLFFFLGGFLFKRKNNIREFALHKGFQLLIPYAFFLVLIYPLHQFFVLQEPIEWLKVILAPLIGGIALKGWTGVFWFITCFFITQQIFNYLVVKFTPARVFILVIIMMIISYINSIVYSTFWLPLNAHVSFGAIAYFYAGYLVRKNGLKIEIVLILILFLAWVFWYNFDLKQDMKYTDYGIPILSFITALSFIFILLILCIWIDKRSEFAFLKRFGIGSMIVMYLHQPIQMSLKSMGGLLASPHLRFVLSSSIAIALFYLIKQNKHLSKYLLGKK